MASPPPATWALVLAAGDGRRFGSDKLVARLGAGPLVEHCLRAVARAVAGGRLEGAVVMHRPGDTVIPALATPLGIVAEVADPGPPALSATLRAGIRRLERIPSAGAALVVLGDQPLLRDEVIDAVLGEAAAFPADVVRPVYRDEPEAPGHPVWLRRSAWPLTADLRGDDGLGARLDGSGLRIRRVPVPGANPDVDTPADLDALRGATPRDA